jgi:serine/threonine protein kinase
MKKPDLLINEIEILNKVQHLPVVPLRDYSTKGEIFDDQNTLRRQNVEFFAMDYYKNGDLMSLLQSETKLPERVVRNWFR